MNAIFCLLLAVLSIWDYPARQQQHTRLRNQFVIALREGDTQTMEETCRKGVTLLPDDPTWHYNLACSLAYFPKRTDEAFEELEKAIDLGFRNAEAIRSDRDLKRLEKLPRFKELIEYAEFMKTRPLLSGPLATVDATGIFGQSIALGEQNLGWDFEAGAFVARLKMATATVTPWTGDFYMNRDQDHSPRGPEAKKRFLGEFPGLTEVRLDQAGRARGMDVNLPNILFPYPVFGNCSRALMGATMWRSLPRALVTIAASKMKTMEKAYLSNQVWVFPSNADTAPVGTNGDVFASITPYCLTTAGRSWSDIPYLRAALLASGSIPPAVKKDLIRRKMLAPTVMTLIRKSLGVVSGEDEYTSLRAHPTALPPNGVNTNRLKKAAAALTLASIPPIVPIKVTQTPPKEKPLWPELTYASTFAWAFVLRADETTRVFFIQAAGAQEFRFVQTHGQAINVQIEQIQPNAARVTIDRTGMDPTHRVDIAVFGRNKGTGWGAPSYVSFARMDPTAVYSDPALTPRGDPPTEAK